MTRFATTLALLALASMLENPLERSLLTVEAVNFGRYDKLHKNDFIEIDKLTTDYYYETFGLLDSNKTRFDDQLYRSMRSIRHTLVINHYDYSYSSEETMRQVAGPKVDEDLCRSQVATLARMAANHSGLPLSALNFLDSAGKTEAGVLNGNFVWLGSHAACIRATISANSARPYVSNEAHVNEDIKGRYCVAHMFAKTWPKWDKYFERNLGLRIGVCLPESCHSIIYNHLAEVRQAVEVITKSSLLEPFNGDRYEITSLYCLPDEDSPFRQWDSGAKSFFAFLTAWLLLLLYLNYRYYERERTVRKLRESVDIKLIISKRRETSNPSDSDSSANSTDNGTTSNNSKHMLSNDPPDLISGEENGADSVRPKLVEQTNRVSERKVSGAAKRAESCCQGLDLIKAFSIEANLNYLLYGRDNELKRRKDDEAAVHGQVDSNTQRRSIPSLQQLDAVSRRTSASNEALIKDLVQHQDEQDDMKSKLAVISHDALKTSKKGARSSSKRVNMDVFDGIKAFFTFYIVLGHTLMFFFGIVNDLRFADERMMDLTLLICLNTLHVVSLFYIVTGILVTYLVFKRQKGNQLFKPLFWSMLIANRYLRLVPLYFMVFWFARHVAPLTGHGDKWYDYRTDPEHIRAYCSEEPWSTMLTLSAADVKIPRDCVPQSWYLSNDFRTLFVLPFYIILLAKNPKAGYLAVLATTMVSCSRLTSLLREAKIDFTVIAHWKPHVYSIMADRLHDVYTDLPIRLSTYLLGVVVGHLLYLYETRQIKKFPNWLTNYGLKVSVLVGGLFFFGAPVLSHPLISQFLPSPDNVDSDTMAILIPIFKVFMEICISIVLLLLATGGGFKMLNRLLSSHISKVLANISYGVFLMHIEFMYKIHIERGPSSYWLLYCNSLFIIAFCNCLSLVTHITFEMPINNVVRYLSMRMVRVI